LPSCYAAPAPELGEHTDEVLAALGYAPEEVEALVAAKVVARCPP
jgi:formyl-CoA transferase